MIIAKRFHPNRELSEGDWRIWYAAAEARLPTRGVWDHAHTWELCRDENGDLDDWRCEDCLQHHVIIYCD